MKNNIYHVDTMGESGFKGRARYASRALQLRRFLFLPYCASILFPLLDAIRLSLSRRSPLYLNHVWLSLYTGWLITLHLTLRTLGYRPRLRSYDESKVIVDS